MSYTIYHKRNPTRTQTPSTVTAKPIRQPFLYGKRLHTIKVSQKISLLNRIDGSEIFRGKISSPLSRPLFISRVQAGFPSLTDEFTEGTLDLNEYLILHKASTFFVRVVGDSMTGVGIFPGDLLIVDRSLTPCYGKIVIAVLNGEMTVKRLEKKKDRVLLCSENENYPDIMIAEADDFSIWGVVTNVIHSLI